MARRYQQPKQRSGAAHGAGDRHRADPRLELGIAIALGLAAIVTAGAVYLNEKQEHKATVDFHQATHRLIEASELGLRTPHGKEAADDADREFQHAEDQQEKATRYTLVEVILASSLFLLGVAGVAQQTRVKHGALVAAGVTFTTALVLLATV
jgi:Flp pilus assembly protein TadB